MPFHSAWFLFAFLPVCYGLFLLAHRIGGWTLAIQFLGVASIVYYAQFGLLPVAVLMASVFANFVVGRLIINSLEDRQFAGTLLIVGVVGNLLTLGYFKYTNFLIDISNQISGAEFSHLHILLPIGVSFFTFIQIGYLIEAYNGQVSRQPFSRYVVFATFFPCITAGPLVMQREMFDQMGERKDSAFDAQRLAVGLTLFTIGLFKKVVIADSIAPYADTVFNGVSGGMAVDQLTAWAGALCYTLQLYFDFSGYTDMALGLGLMFGIKLPLNFNSPFKATNISDFWRRWHMTMTRFFTNYIFSPMAMNGMRSALSSGASPLTRYVQTAAVPAIVTFLIAGIWHGDGWTFVIYGLIHGFAIAAYLGWRELNLVAIPKPVGWAMTMAVVVTGLVVFRSDNVSTALTMLANMWVPLLSMTTANAVFVDVELKMAFAYVALLGGVVLLFPNSQQILHLNWVSVDPMPPETKQEAGALVWRPTAGHSLATGVVCFLALTSVGASSSFLYYQF